MLGQNYPNLEYIIIDGGSTDGSADIIQKYDNDLAYWVSEPDHGQSHAINKGMERATGDILGWINSDDFYLPGVFDVVAHSLSETESPGLIYGGCLMFNYERGWANVRKARAPFDREQLRINGFIDQPSSFWRRALWDTIGPLDETLHYAFDWDWFNRAANQGCFQPMPLLVSAYRIHSGHKTGTGGAARRLEIRQVISRYADHPYQELFRIVDEDVLPTIKRLRRLLNGRGVWRLQGSIERLFVLSWYSQLNRRFGYQNVQHAITALDH